jgi:hypothetical protein
MPLSINCPHCKATLEANVKLGQVIQCPACKEQFEIERKLLNGKDDSLSNNKYLIPLGYAAFVGLPILITIIVVFSMSGKKPAPESNDDPPHVAKNETRTSSSNAPKKTPKKGPPPRQSSDKYVEPEIGGTPSDDSNVKSSPSKTGPDTSTKTTGPDASTKTVTTTTPKPEITPTPKTETTTTPKIETSPMLETNGMAIAPPPHEVLWKLPLSGYESDWKYVGAVAVRIGGLAISKAPLVDGKNNVVESQTPFLVAIIEVRKNDSKEKRTLLSWTIFNNYYSSMFLKNDKGLPNGRLPAGSKLRTKTSDQQLVPDDGSSVRDILLFAVPDDDAGELNLRLEAERIGEKGDIWFKIPALAWKKQ